MAEQGILNAFEPCTPTRLSSNWTSVQRTTQLLQQVGELPGLVMVAAMGPASAGGAGMAHGNAAGNVEKASSTILHDARSSGMPSLFLKPFYGHTREADQKECSLQSKTRL